MARKLILITSLLSLMVLTVNSQNTNSLKMTKAELLEAGGITITFENFDFETEIKVIQFEVSATVEGAYYQKDLRVYGTSKFSDEVRNLIKDLNVGSKIIFDNIRVQLADGSFRDLEPIIVRII